MYHVECALFLIASVSRLIVRASCWDVGLGPKSLKINKHNKCFHQFSSWQQSTQDTKKTIMLNQEVLKISTRWTGILSLVIATLDVLNIYYLL